MAITIVNQWTAKAADQDTEMVTSPTPGRTLVAVIAARVVDGSAPTLAIGDVSRNGWTLISDPVNFAASAHATAQLQAEVWACPAVRYDGWPWELVYASAMQITASDVGSVVMNVIEVNGMAAPQLAVESVTLGTASAATSLAITAPAPAGAANCLMVGVAVADGATAATPSGTGWAALTAVTSTNPNIGMASAWREATTGGTVTFTLGTSQNWAGAVVALRTAGFTPAQPNPAWPPTQLQVGLGYDLSTPLPRVRWTDQTTRYLSLDSDRGIQSEMGTAQQGNTTLTIRDDDGAYTPRTVALASAANAAGTTTTIKMPDASALAIHVTDFFRLKTAAGILKQLDTFQVTGLSSVSGTTTVTFARADGTAGGALAATASGDVYAGIAIDLYIPWRLLKTVAGTTYTPASGWLRDLPIDFSDAHWAEVNAAGADALEVLSVAANPSALRGEIYRRPGLYGYWPLDDSSGAGYAANASGVSNTVLKQTTSKFGAGTSTTVGFGASTQDISVGGTTTVTASLLGDPATGWAQDGQTAAEINANKGYCLAGQDMGFPSISGGVTISGALLVTLAQSTTVSSSTTNPTIFILRNGDPGAGVSAGSIIKLSFDRSADTAIITVWDKSTHASTTTAVGGDQIATTRWVHWTVAFNRTSWAVYVNGFLQGSGSCNLVAGFTGIEVGGEASTWFHGKTFPGTHAHVTVYNRKLTVQEIANLGWIAANGWMPNGIDTLDGRSQRKLNSVFWKGVRTLGSAIPVLAPEAAPAGSVVDLLSDIAQTQDGLFFADAANQVQQRSRVTAYHQTPRAVLGSGAGEIPYQPGQVYSFDPTYIYNDVEIENTSYGAFTPTGVTTLVAIDDTSAARYGARTLQLTTRLGSNPNAYHLAWWLLGRYAYPRVRVPSVVVSAAAGNDTASSAGRWAFVCGVEVGDIVTVNRRPIGQPAISVRCRVMSVAPTFDRTTDPAVAQVTLILAAAPPLVAVHGSATLGTLAGTVLGA